MSPQREMGQNLRVTWPARMVRHRVRVTPRARLSPKTKQQNNANTDVRSIKLGESFPERIRTPVGDRRGLRSATFDR